MSHVYMALVGLSIGWGMRAGLAQRFCFKCASRAFGLKTMRFAMEKKFPRLVLKVILSFGLGWTALLLLQDAAQVFGWKRILDFAKLSMKLNGGNDGRKKT